MCKSHFVLFRSLEQYCTVFPYTNRHSNPYMASGENHSINLRYPLGDVARYRDAINHDISWGMPITWRTGLRNKAPALIKGLMFSWLWYCTPCARRQVLCCVKVFKVILYISDHYPYSAHVSHLSYFVFDLAYHINVPHWFQRELTVEMKWTTGILPNTTHTIVCSSGRIAGTIQVSESGPILTGGKVADIRINFWNRAKVRRFPTHSLAGGGSHNLGHHAFRLETMLTALSSRADTRFYRLWLRLLGFCTKKALFCTAPPAEIA